MDDLIIKETRSVIASAGWPEHLLLDSTKAPRIVSNVDEFCKEVTTGTHLDRIVVFPNGVQLLGQDKAIDPHIVESASSSRNACEFIERLGLARSQLMACVAWNAGGDCSRLALDNLEMQWKQVRTLCPFKCRGTSYIAELRKAGDRLMPALSTTMKEALKTNEYLYWDDQAGGIFVGGPGAGYHLHQDSHQVSNIGTNWVGWKLLAVWKHGEETLDVVEAHGDTFFLPPLTDSQKLALESASCVALAPPGSVFLFSGSNAHVVLNAGSCCCCVGYESFVNLHVDHVQALLGTHDPLTHHEDCWMDSGKRGLRALAQSVMDRVDIKPDIIDIIRSSCTPLAALIQEKLALRQKHHTETNDGRDDCKRARTTEPHDDWLASLGHGANISTVDAKTDDVSDSWLASLSTA